MRPGIISSFVRHPVAPNLAMAVMILAGIWALSQLTRQILPTFELSVVRVTVNWPGASAEDVQLAVTQPLEDQLRGQDALKSLRSTSREGLSEISLEFVEDADMGQALDEVKQQVAQVRNLPPTVEEPVVTLLARNEPVARLVLTGADLSALRPLVRGFERELRGLGLARIEIEGLPEEEIAIQIDSRRLGELQLSLQDVSQRVREFSTDIPAGSVGRADAARQLRSLDQARSVDDFLALPLLADEQGRLLTLADVAQIERRARADEPLLFVNGRPAAELQVLRAETEDAIDVAERLLAWVERTRLTLPAGMELLVYDEPWRQVDERIDLMVENAVGGLVLVAIALFVFLNGRVAFWVAVGIPVSVMAGLMALKLFGGSLNMISLFAMVMALGIVVDDAIVVGEEAMTRYQAGAKPLEAAEQAAYRMLGPVMAASLTTVAAFVPLMTIGGAGGTILFAIPLIMICVVLASLAECFLVLPGHLRHSLEASSRKPPSRWRLKFDTAWERFRCGPFRAAVQAAVRERGTTLALAVGGLVVAIGLVAGGRLEFTLFPQPDNSSLQTLIRFAAGTPQARVADFASDARAALAAVEAEAGERLVELDVTRLGVDARGNRGSNLASMRVQLVPQAERSLANADIIRRWRALTPTPGGLESFVILNTTGGPHGNDIELNITGTDPEALKAASEMTMQALRGIAGVSGVRDDMAWGKEQLIFSLSPSGEALGLTADALGAQLRAAFQGELVQVFQDRGDSVEVRVLVSDPERDRLATLDTLPIRLPSGETTPLSDVATLDYRRGFESLRRNGGELSVQISADVDERLNNNNAVRELLAADVLPAVTALDGVNGYNFGGDAESQQETLGDVGTALPLALLLIYIILAWVFQSYLWPLAVLSIVPFGLVGALFGHWLLGVDLTLMSIFGLFGLIGIVINDSIILVSVFRELTARGLSVAEAAAEAVVRRSRAVILTSITTVFGVMPVLFDGDLQAQFLRPLVTSLAFGLLFATFLVLFLLPALLAMLGARRGGLSRLRDWLLTPAVDGRA
ncbi:MAG: efflux RND transporter permease subunit [Gammaproteobacteria bacterium]|nr:MAG: efflux RND transporter permease subunit [Gammaproteobacteria bacterium]